MLLKNSRLPDFQDTSEAGGGPTDQMNFSSTLRQDKRIVLTAQHRADAGSVTTRRGRSLHRRGRRRCWSFDDRPLSTICNIRTSAKRCRINANVSESYPWSKHPVVAQRRGRQCPNFEPSNYASRSRRTSLRRTRRKPHRRLKCGSINLLCHKKPNLYGQKKQRSCLYRTARRRRRHHVTIQRRALSRRTFYPTIRTMFAPGVSQKAHQALKDGSKAGQ